MWVGRQLQTNNLFFFFFAILTMTMLIQINIYFEKKRQKNITKLKKVHALDANMYCWMGPV